MLNKVHLTYFQRHEDLTVDFGAGLSSIRAGNENGKSTIIRGIMYALYGSKALPASLSSTVTWGRPEKDLRVELDTTFGGESYTFTRSKGGAEVLKNGHVFVTGQTEVSTFAASLIGADLATANRLMVANQGNLRGALDAGPKAAAEMVESLADFELFDKLLERSAERLTLGSDVSARQRLEEAKDRLETLSAEKPDTSAFEAIIAGAPEAVAELDDLIASSLQPVYEAASQALDQAKNNRSTYDLLNNNLTKAQHMLDDAKAQMIAATAKAVPVDTSAIKSLQAQLDGVADVMEQHRVYEALAKLNATYPEAFWDEGAEALQAEVTKAETEIETLNQQISDLDSQGSTLRTNCTTLARQIQKDDHCSACGQKLVDHEEIARKNADLEAQVLAINVSIADVDAQINPLQSQIAERKSELADLKGVFGSASLFDAFIRSNAQYVTVDTTFVPPKITWKGAAPSGATADPSEIRIRISDIEAADKASRNAAARVEALTQTVRDYGAQVETFTSQLAAYDLVNVEQFQQDKDAKYQQLASARVTIERVRDEVRQAETEILLLNQAFESQKTAIAEMQVRITICEQEIEDLGFNNALVKRIRDLRPVVANQLWNMVLGAVSGMFSEMRGQKSSVTRTKDGFQVNGESIETLSGSTLDILAIAIRVALIKTFIPNCPFFFMDEPFAALDAARTEMALGFIQTLDFPQTLIITHEGVTEAISDATIHL